jgi:hypothetical protein
MDYILDLSPKPLVPTSKRFMNMHVYEACPRKDKRGVDLVSDALPFGRVCYGAR